MATADPRDFISVGYENGLIPSCALVRLKEQPDIALHPQAAEQMDKLLRLAKQQNINFSISSGYRSLEGQITAKRLQGRGAATPGTSKHGWGTTVDIGTLYTLAQTTADSINLRVPANQKVDRFSAAVHDEIRRTSRLYQWLAENAPKYGWVNPEWAKDGNGVDECWHWEYQAWPSLPNTVRPQNRPTTKPVVEPCGPQLRRTDTPGGVSEETGITPYIGSLESFHPNIQYELTRRRVSSETANAYMPFVRLTSLTNVLNSNLSDGGKAWCPSLGPHGQDIINFNEIYSTTPQNNRSIIGWATKDKPRETQISEDDAYERVPVVVESSATETDPPNIPIPGIAEVSAERGTAGPMGVRGGLLKADLKIIAYSVGQVDTLLRYFLRPATRVVLEFGRMSSNQSEPLTPFNWKLSADEVAKKFKDLITDPKEQTTFLNQHVYSNNGNYEIFIAYVVKFNLQVTKDNLYEISLTLHSVQQFEIPTKHTSVKSLCSDATDKCSAMDILEDFDDAYSWKQKTFKKLMDAVDRESDRNPKYQWNNHVVRISNPDADPKETGANSPEAGTKDSDYFVSWNFFVTVILNDPKWGILSLIDENNETRKLIKTGLLKSTRSKVTEVVIPGKENEYDGHNKLIANEVGYHQDLRSTNAEVMIIYNKSAQDRRDDEDKTNYEEILKLAISDKDERAKVRKDTHIDKKIKESAEVKDFHNLQKDVTKSGTGTLLNGVWLNTKAIKQAFMSTDTVSSAIQSLLSMMNAATEGYWNLQLYSSERPNPGLFVIDWGLAKKVTSGTPSDETFPTIDEEENELNNILDSITKIDIARYRKSGTVDDPKYIYMFNRQTKRFVDGEIGSDIIDMKVEFNLPQVIAVQAIAGVGGPAQKSTLQSLDIPQLNEISLIKDLFPSCSNDKKDNFICPDNSPCPKDTELTNLERVFAEARAAEATADSALFNPRFIGVSPGDEGLGIGFIAAQRERATQTAETNLDKLRVQRKYGNTAVVDTVRELSSLGTALDLVEFNPGKMMKKLNLDSRTTENGYSTPYAHAFNSSNLTKTIVNVTLPGIGGIELFQSFLVDRVPSILKRGFYVVTKVAHKFSPDNGWVTSIEGRFRYRPDNEGTKEFDCATIASGGGTRGFARGLYGPAADVRTPPTSR